MDDLKNYCCTSSHIYTSLVVPYLSAAYSSSWLCLRASEACKRPSTAPRQGRNYGMGGGGELKLLRGTETKMSVSLMRTSAVTLRWCFIIWMPSPSADLTTVSLASSHSACCCQSSNESILHRQPVTQRVDLSVPGWLQNPSIIWSHSKFLMYVVHYLYLSLTIILSSGLNWFCLIF